MSTAPACTSDTDALQMLESALSYLSAADPTQMPAVIQAQALTTLERADARTPPPGPRSWPHSPPARGTARTGTTVPGPG